MKDFWKKHPKKLQSQQVSAVKKKGRQSTVEPASAAGTKRGRKSTAKAESEDEEDQSLSTSRATKKAKRGNANNAKSGRSVSPEIDVKAETMPDNYTHLEDWTPIVKTIDTVEIDPTDNRLYVYFTL